MALNVSGFSQNRASSQSVLNGFFMLKQNQHNKDRTGKLIISISKGTACIPKLVQSQ